MSNWQTHSVKKDDWDGLTQAARKASERGDFAGAQMLLNRALALANEKNESVQVEDSLRMLAELNLRQGRLKDAEEIYNKLLVELDKRHQFAQRAEVEFNLGDIQFRMRNSIEGEEICERALRTYRAGEHNACTFADMCIALARNLVRAGRVTRAEALYDEAVHVLDSESNSTLHAYALTEYGRFHQQVTLHFDQAETMYLRALNLERQIGADRPQIGHLLHLLARANASQDKNMEALDYYEQALSHFELQSADEEILRLICSLGQFCLQSGNLLQADVVYQRGLQLIDSLPESLETISVLTGAGETFILRKNLQSAESLFERAIKLAHKLAPGTLVEARCRRHGAEIAAQLGKEENFKNLLAELKQD